MTTESTTASEKIAVVILNWNGADMMRRFLPSVVEYSKGEGEVIVADNGSTDHSCEMLEKEFPTVRIIRFTENYGFAEGYNRALAQLEHKYFLLLNSDVEVTPNWLTPLRAYMDQHPEVGACQPKLLSWHQKEMFEYAGGAGGYLDHYGYPFCRGRVFADLEKDNGQYNQTVPLLWATGAALLVRRTDWNDAGGLDGRFFAHMEEIDLCWRMRTRGRQIVCIGESKVYHVGGASLEQGNPRKTFLNFRNNLLMLYKNLPENELNRVMRIRGLLDWIAALKFFLTGDVANGKAVLKARKDYQKMRPDFQPQRAENLKKRTLQQVPERTTYSLLWQYYLKGKKKFSDLPQL